MQCLMQLVGHNTSIVEAIKIIVCQLKPPVGLIDTANGEAWTLDVFLDFHATCDTLCECSFSSTHVAH
ncbi:hypothetical protein D3C85_1279250 [compost metagenome]